MPVVFSAVKRFDLTSGEAWPKFIAWSGLTQLREVLLDLILCPTVFNELTAEDWRHNVQEDFQITLFHDLDYVLSKVAGDDRVNVLALLQNPTDDEVRTFSDRRFVFGGFDLVELQTGISALVNCGGTGENALYFAGRGCTVTGIDFLEEPITRAGRKATERGLSATFLVKDALTLKDWSERFDNVIRAEVSVRQVATAWANLGPKNARHKTRRTCRIGRFSRVSAVMTCSLTHESVSKPVSKNEQNGDSPENLTIRKSLDYNAFATTKKRKSRSCRGY